MSYKTFYRADIRLYPDRPTVYQPIFPIAGTGSFFGQAASTTEASHLADTAACDIPPGPEAQPESKLRSILIFLTALSLISAACVGYIYYHSLKQSVAGEAQKRIILQTETIKNRFNNYLSENLRSVKALAGLPGIKSALADANPANLALADANLDIFVKAMGADVCYLLDPDGLTIAASNRSAPDSFVGKNYGFRPYFREALAGRPYVYMALGVTSGKRGAYYSHPVYPAPGESPAGVVVIKEGMSGIEATLQETDGGVWLLTGRHDIVFAASRDDWRFHFLWAPTEDQAADVAATRPVRVRPVALDGARPHRRRQGPGPGRQHVSDPPGRSPPWVGLAYLFPFGRGGGHGEPSDALFATQPAPHPGALLHPCRGGPLPLHQGQCRYPPEKENGNRPAPPEHLSLRPAGDNRRHDPPPGDAGPSGDHRGTGHPIDRFRKRISLSPGAGGRRDGDADRSRGLRTFRGSAPGQTGRGPVGSGVGKRPAAVHRELQGLARTASGAGFRRSLLGHRHPSHGRPPSGRRHRFRVFRQRKRHRGRRTAASVPVRRTGIHRPGQRPSLFRSAAGDPNSTEGGSGSEGGQPGASKPRHHRRPDPTGQPPPVRRSPGSGMAAGPGAEAAVADHARRGLLQALQRQPRPSGRRSLPPGHRPDHFRQCPPARRPRGPVRGAKNSP